MKPLPKNYTREQLREWIVSRRASLKQAGRSSVEYRLIVRTPQGGSLCATVPVETPRQALKSFERWLRPFILRPVPRDGGEGGR